MGPRLRESRESAWVAGLELATGKLQEACSHALGTLPAPMPHGSTAAATKTVGFPGDPFHAPLQRLSQAALQYECRELPPARAKT